jgi:glycosyltransferase involved in cell wall biosynthesis
LLATFDAACIAWLSRPLYRFGVSPNKLMDYMISGKPVLNAIEAGNDIVAESGCGVSVTAEHPAALAEGARRLADMTAAERAAMGLRGRDFILKHHEYGVLASRFIDVIERARSERAAP